MLGFSLLYWLFSKLNNNKKRKSSTAKAKLESCSQPPKEFKWKTFNVKQNNHTIVMHYFQPSNHPMNVFFMNQKNVIEIPDSLHVRFQSWIQPARIRANFVPSNAKNIPVLTHFDNQIFLNKSRANNNWNFICVQNTNLLSISINLIAEKTSFRISEG